MDKYLYYTVHDQTRGLIRRVDARTTTTIHCLRGVGWTSSQRSGNRSCEKQGDEYALKSSFSHSRLPLAVLTFKDDSTYFCQ